MTTRAAGAWSFSLDGGLGVPDGCVVDRRHGDDLLGVDEDVEAVRERDAVAGGHKGLRFASSSPWPECSSVGRKLAWPSTSSTRRAADP